MSTHTSTTLSYARRALGDALDTWANDVHTDAKGPTVLEAGSAIANAAADLLQALIDDETPAEMPKGEVIRRMPNNLYACANTAGEMLEVAADLRDALKSAANAWHPMERLALLADVEDHAVALLHLIGESA